MIEISAAGTHGSTMPGGPIVRFIMAAYAALYRLLGGRIVGPKTLLLTTVGARSGRRRTAALASYPDGDGRWIVVGSAGGAARHPAWFINLARRPDEVWIDVGRRRFKVTPALLRDDERAAAWQRVISRSPNFAGYEQKTDREMPVVRLTASSEGDPPR